MTPIKPKPKAADESITVRCQASLKKAFARHCQQHGTTLSDGIVQLMVNSMKQQQAEPEISTLIGEAMRKI